MSEIQLLVLGTEEAFSLAVASVLLAQLPHANCRRLDPASMRHAPAVQAVVIDARSDAVAGAGQARRLRAMGFAGAVAIVSSAALVASANASTDGYSVVSPDQLASQLVPRLAEEMLLAESPYADQVMRARRLVAAGEIAARLQHSLNNPLMALQAETQLMQLDNVPAEQAESLERMLGLCRRMVDLTKGLDGLAERRKTS